MWNKACRITQLYRDERLVKRSNLDLSKCVGGEITNVKSNRVYTVTRHKISYFHAMNITSVSVAASLFCATAVPNR
jgi:hypothetical protein